MSDHEQKITPDEIGATESRLLQALDAQEEKIAEDLQNFIAYAGTPLEPNKTKSLMPDIIEKIRTVFDPEIPINVYDMGLIYKTDQAENGDIHIDMTLTAPTCPIAGILPQQVADAIAELDGVGKVEVQLVWEPAWTPDKLSNEAKELLELF